MCRIASIFLLQRLKGSMSGYARAFNNIDTCAVVKFVFLQGKAPKDNHAILIKILEEYAPSYATIKTGWLSLNVVMLPPVMRLILRRYQQHLIYVSVTVECKKKADSLLLCVLAAA